jgi:hypothetical protein
MPFEVIRSPCIVLLCTHTITLLFFSCKPQKVETIGVGEPPAVALARIFECVHVHLETRRCNCAVSGFRTSLNRSLEGSGTVMEWPPTDCDASLHNILEPIEEIRYESFSDVRVHHCGCESTCFPSSRSSSH